MLSFMNYPRKSYPVQSSTLAIPAVGGGGRRRSRGVVTCGTYNETLPKIIIIIVREDNKSNQLRTYF